MDDIVLIAFSQQDFFDEIYMPRFRGHDFLDKIFGTTFLGQHFWMTFWLQFLQRDFLRQPKTSQGYQS